MKTLKILLTSLTLLFLLPTLPAASAPRLDRLAEISLPPGLDFGPWTIKATPRRLVLLGTHVSSRTLAAFDRKTWKQAWRYPGKVEAFVLRGGLVIASDLKKKVVALDQVTGKQRWVVKGYYLATYQRRPLHPDARTTDAQLLLAGKTAAVVDVKTGRVTRRAPTILAIQRYRRGHPSLAGYSYRLPPRMPLVPKGAKLLALVQVEARDGAVEGIYAWSLMGRRFTLQRHDEKLAAVVHQASARKSPQASVSWEMPKLKGSGAFNGAPEPNKLATEVGLIAGRLLLYENYVNYRWSEGRGNNRLTSVRLPGPTIDAQLWGQRGIKKGGDYRGFVLRPDAVFVTAGSTLHWQHRAPKVSRLRLERPLSPARGSLAAGHLLSAGSCQLLAPLAPGRQLCLVLDRRQVAPKRYTSAVEVRHWYKDRLSAPVRHSLGAWDLEAMLVDGGLLMIPIMKRSKPIRCKLRVLRPRP
jgi:PQQ-like domain